MIGVKYSLLMLNFLISAQRFKNIRISKIQLVVIKLFIVQ